MLNTGCVRNGDVRRSAGGSVQRRAPLPSTAVPAPALPRPANTATIVLRRRRSDVVSSSEMPIAVAGVAEVDAARLGGLPHRRRRRRPRSAACRSRRVRLAEPERRAAPRRRRASGRGRARRSPAARPGRDTPRTSPRCSRAAPAPCRCSTSPSRGGCAARASAAPCGRPGWPRASTETPMMRPGACRTNASRVAKNAACGPP